MNARWTRRLWLGAFLLLLAFVPAAAAQQPVTADDVNDIAKRLYCPVCENQPLDTCMTEACYRWRDEIRIQLEGGATPEEVVADFVARFGERAIGTPLDPTLRTITLVTPYVLAALALLIGVFTFTRWRARHASAPASARADAAGSASLSTHDDYLSQVERDLRG
jgi:cytochrome c-type biogenesis protein CcmH